LSLSHLSGEGLRPLPVSPETVPLFCNVPDQELFAQVQSAVDRQLPILTLQEPNDDVCVIVGGGPSARNFLPELTARKNNGQIIYALNGAGRWLVDHGIDPDALIILDARPENVKFLFGIPKTTTLYLASQCHPVVFDASEGFDVVMWHANYEGKSGVKEHRETILIGGGTSVGMRSLSVAYVRGYRRIHLYGFDSSYHGVESHPYDQPENDGEKLEVCTVEGKAFHAPPWMIRQASDFPSIATDLARKGCALTVHGEGLLPWVAQCMEQPPGNLACYDLSCAPASYDFLTWLVIAEMNRRERGFPGPLKVAFKAGPKDGFRDDNLPVGAEGRREIFDNVIRPALKLVGAVETDEALEGCRYHYTMNTVSDAARNGIDVPSLKATAEDLARVDTYLNGQRPIVITLREAEHWPQRNSNLDAWLKFAAWVKEPVIFVRDTAKADEPLPFPTCPEASRDIGLRTALYERAKINLFVSNGPGVIPVYSDSPYLLIKPLADDYIVKMEDWWRKGIGVAPGEQFPWAKPNQRIAWCDDSFENIMSAWADMQTNLQVGD
jgi:hypothetical protein